MNKEIDRIFHDMDQTFKQVQEEMDQMAKDMAELLKPITWSEWKPHKIKFPKRINSKWYWPGDTIYRKQRIGPGGTAYKYGDQFDVLKEQHD